MIPSDKMTAHFSGVLTADFRNYLKDSLRRFSKIALRQRRTSFFCTKNVSNFSVLRQTVPETFFRPAGDDFSARNTYPDATTTQKRRLGTPFSFILLKKQVLCLTYYLFFRLKTPYENASHVNLSLNSLCVSNSSKAPSKWILYTVLELLT